jgi:hypothetical protein
MAKKVESGLQVWGSKNTSEVSGYDLTEEQQMITLCLKTLMILKKIKSLRQKAKPLSSPTCL